MSFREDKNFDPGEMFMKPLHLLPLLKDTAIQGKGYLFWVPKPTFNHHSVDTFSSHNMNDPKECIVLIITMMTAFTK